MTVSLDLDETLELLRGAVAAVPGWQLLPEPVARMATTTTYAASKAGEQLWVNLHQGTFTIAYPSRDTGRMAELYALQNRLAAAISNAVPRDRDRPPPRRDGRRGRALDDGLSIALVDTTLELDEMRALLETTAASQVVALAPAHHEALPAGMTFLASTTPRVDVTIVHPGLVVDDSTGAYRGGVVFECVDRAVATTMRRTLEVHCYDVLQAKRASLVSRGAAGAERARAALATAVGARRSKLRAYDLLRTPGGADGTSGGWPRGIDPEAWPLDPHAGTPMRHVLTVRIPAGYAARRSIGALAVFAGGAATPPKSTKRIKGVRSPSVEIRLLPAAVLDAEPVKRKDAPRPGRSVPIALRLRELDPNAGRVPEEFPAWGPSAAKLDRPSQWKGYVPPASELGRLLALDDQGWCEDHFGGTTTLVEGRPETSARYLELTATLLGDGFADTVVVIDLATEALEVLYVG